ncbi:MAG: hypothetical protein M9894_04580 [Planctomycetes bacterium]|nr:hypothetical protein [Planctomycetota bacterium]
MAEDLADLRQRCAAAKHLACGRMAEAMSPNGDMPRLRPAFVTILHRSGREVDMRPACARTALAKRSWATALEIRHDGLADVLWHGQPVPAGALAPHEHLAALPIDVLEPAGRDFANAQAKPKQEEEHGSHGARMGSFDRAAEQSFRHVSRQRLGQPGEAPPGDGWDCKRQIVGTSPPRTRSEGTNGAL